MIAARQRRFWRRVEVAATGAGFALRLDERPLRTPAKAALAVPTRALAAAIAAEWSAVQDVVMPDDMPLTRAANSSIDRVAPAPGPVVGMIADYAATDLVCYRAEAPEALRRRQAAAWDPLLDWSARALGAPLDTFTGVMPGTQPPRSVAALRGIVAAHDPFRLTGLAELVVLSGSLVIGLAVARRAIDPAAAWPLSRIDETWQAEQWGEDAEAAAAAERRRAAFLDAAAYLRLLDDEPGG